MKHSSISLIGITMSIFVTILAACEIPIPVTPTATPVPTNTSIPDTPSPSPTGTPITDGMVDVGGYSLYIYCLGEGSPSVILDSGLNGPYIYWFKTAGFILAEVDVMVCMYDRAFLGNSDPAPEKPRTSLDMANDLHNLLINANIPEPYVLVAHSMAGFTARYYVEQHPLKVAGVVFVDASHPDERESSQSILSDDTYDNDRGIMKLRDMHTWDPSATREYWDLLKSTDMVRELGPMGSIPLVVLTRDINKPLLTKNLLETNLNTELPLGIIVELEENWLRLQKENAKLSTDSTLIIVENSNHMIPDWRPDKIAEGVRIIIENQKDE